MLKSAPMMCHGSMTKFCQHTMNASTKYHGHRINRQQDLDLSNNRADRKIPMSEHKAH